MPLVGLTPWYRDERALDAQTEEDALPLWEYVPVADYAPPAEPVIHTARKGLAIFRSLVQRDEAGSASPLKAEDELQTLPQWQLERIAPAPDWSSAAEALHSNLKDWLDQDKPDQPVIAVVGPPYSGHIAMLTAWAERQRWTVLHPPSPEQILAGDDTWLSEQSGDNAPWVFPTLEKAYLRHAAGLSLIRRFLDRAYSGALGRGIFGCDSWAWAFLRHVWHSRLSVALTLQAIDRARLAGHLQGLADAAKKRMLLFRQSDNGAYVLPPPESHDDSAKMSDYLQYLAAHSRGMLGVAWAVWRTSLRTAPDAMMTEDAEAKGREAPHQTIWVTPWNQLKHPALPAGAGPEEALVLHALLLHNGLPVDVLRQILPLSPSQVVETLFQLEHSRLVARHDAVWQVSPLGYPAVRQFLQAKDYAVDQF